MFLLYLNIACSLGNKLHTKIRQEGWVDGIIRPSITLFLAVSGFHFFVLRPTLKHRAARKKKPLVPRVLFHYILQYDIGRYNSVRCYN